jgi:hypothetical protein
MRDWGGGVKSGVKPQHGARKDLRGRAPSSMADQQRMAAAEEALLQSVAGRNERIRKIRT